MKKVYHLDSVTYCYFPDLEIHNDSSSAFDGESIYYNVGLEN